MGRSWHSPCFVAGGGRPIPRLRRAAALLVALAAGVAITATPAGAHGGLANYVASVTSITPLLQGLEVAIVGGDDQVLLTNGTDRTVVVPGYAGEPYLRFERDRVFANRRSPAYYLGSLRTGAVVPADADPGAPPEWVEVATGNTFAWHDQRVLWSDAARPAAVQASPGERQVIREWEIVLDAGEPVAVRGVLEWVPSADGSIWLGVGLVLLVTGGVAGRRLTREIEVACRRLAPAAVVPALFGLAVALNGGLEGGDALRDGATILLAALSAMLSLRARSLPSAIAALSTAVSLLLLGLVGGVSRFGQVSDPINGPEDQLLPMAIVLTAGLAFLVAVLLLIAVARERRTASYSTATM